ncbi:MAG: hypothetical protein ACE5HO_15405 [bacterium]
MNRLTFEEIIKFYGDEWVLIEDPEENEMLEIKSGKVIAHSPCRKDIYAELKKRRGNLAIRYTGKIKGKIFVL